MSQELFKEFVRKKFQAKSVQGDRLGKSLTTVDSVDLTDLELGLEEAAEEFVNWCDIGFPLKNRPKWLKWKAL